MNNILLSDRQKIFIAVLALSLIGIGVFIFIAYQSSQIPQDTPGHAQQQDQQSLRDMTDEERYEYLENLGASSSQNNAETPLPSMTDEERYEYLENLGAPPAQ